MRRCKILIELPSPRSTEMGTPKPPTKKITAASIAVLFSFILIGLLIFQEPTQASAFVDHRVTESWDKDDAQGSGWLGDFSPVSLQRRLLQAPPPDNSYTIGLACSATRYPTTCFNTLNPDSRAQGLSAQGLAQLLVTISKERSFIAIADGQTLATSVVPPAANPNLTAVSAQCTEELDLASYHLQNSEFEFPGNFLKEIQAWLSGALAQSNDCYYALTPFRDMVNVDPFVPAMLDRLNVTVEIVSDALAMVDALIGFGPDVTLWKPPPETRVEQIDRLLTSYSDLFPLWLGYEDQMDMSQDVQEFTPSVTVSLNSMMPSIQEAVNQAPSWSPTRYVIYIQAGVYNEIVRVPKEKTNLMFLGDGIGLTVITGNMDTSVMGMTTWLSATVAVNGAGFLARGITFENSAGPEQHQAVALRVSSDQAAFQSCSIESHQDSLYTHTLRQFYKDCTITGTVDFIFGNSASVFQNCNIVVRARPGVIGGYTNTLTAQGRTDPGQNTALVFQNCSVYGTAEYEALYLAQPMLYRVYLGRPWKTYSRTIFIYTSLSEIVHIDGWLPWNGDFALNTLLDAEYGSYGPGVIDLTRRVWWSTQLSLPQAQIFSTQRFLQADTWLPATLVPYSPVV